MQMLKADTSVKDSLTGKRQRCAWSFSYALSVVKNWDFSQAIALGLYQAETRDFNKNVIICG